MEILTEEGKKMIAETRETGKLPDLTREDIRDLFDALDFLVKFREMELAAKSKKKEKPSKAYDMNMLRDFIRLQDKLVVPKIEAMHGETVIVKELLEVVCSLVCDLFEVLKVNPLDKSIHLRQYLQYHRLGLVSDRPGFKVLNGRLINAYGEDCTDEKYYNGKESGKSLTEIQNEEFTNEFENEDDDGEEAEVLQ